MDAVTGTMLVFAPACTLKLMLIEQAPTEPVYMRFIGAFVMAVGFSYLLPLFESAAARRDARVCGVLETTMIIRLTIGSFVAASVVSDGLDTAWLSVGISDLVLGSAQVFLLQRGVFARD
jgi:hypothetical protein